MAPRRYPCLPPGWIREEVSGLGPFATRQVLRRPDGTRVLWESRRHRKRPGRPGGTWWAPAALGWWIGVLFAVGSVCFTLGAVPAYADALGAMPDNLTYFVGSLFFTSAALLQFGEVCATEPARGPGPGPALLRLVHPWPDRIDWWATLVQLVGTVLFNLSTAHAAWAAPAGPGQANHLVWRPDALGSVCFLVASWLAWAEVCHGPGAARGHQLSWWIALCNLAGSVAFGVSAVAAKVKPDGSVRSLALTNLGTFVGAVGFLVGALLLLPERTEGEEPDVALRPGPAPVPAPG
jgi:hypothetical protein